MEFEILQQLIVEVLGVDSGEIHKDSTFMGDLGADSLDVFQILTGVEENLHIEIPKDEIKQIETVVQAVNLITKCRN